MAVAIYNNARVNITKKATVNVKPFVANPIIHLDFKYDYWPTDNIFVYRYNGDTLGTPKTEYPGWRNRIEAQQLYDTGSLAITSYATFNLDEFDGGGCIEVSGVRSVFGDYYAIPPTTIYEGVLDFSQDVSVLFWIKPSYTPQGPIGLFTNNPTPGAYEKGIRLFVNTYTEPFTSDGRLIVEIGDGISNADGLGTDVGAVSEDVWQQVTLTLNKAMTTAKLYINGQLAASKTNLTTTEWNTQYLTRILSLGGGYDYHGKVGLIKIYTRELTDNQVVNEFNTDKSRFGL